MDRDTDERDARRFLAFWTLEHTKEPDTPRAESFAEWQARTARILAQRQEDGE